MFKEDAGEALVFQLFGTDLHVLEPRWNRQEGHFCEEVRSGFWVLEPRSHVALYALNRFGTAKTAIFVRMSQAVWGFGTAIPLFGTGFQIICSRKSQAKRSLARLSGTDFYCLEPLWNRQEGHFCEEVRSGFWVLDPPSHLAS